jgi:hypothetical protein
MEHSVAKWLVNNFTIPDAHALHQSKNELVIISPELAGVKWNKNSFALQILFSHANTFMCVC